ncbi:MAG TPA: MBL fold metallo-hydrolase [Thermomicrobiales bacterium]|nr:MBL fold metallo-hydrolase [Thermomicrobiales bacterium]
MTDNQTRWLGDDLAVVDLQFQELPALIASYVVRTADGLALVDVGPGSTVPALIAGLEQLGLSVDDVRYLLVTHIHLDHAGAAGSLLARLPEATMYVHERGLRHMLNPERLLASARQVYGALMDPLWGEFLPTPAERSVSVADGDRLELGGVTFDIHYTPGHANHHVAYYEPERSIVFAGDVAGVRIPPSPLVWPPTPPPDINVEAWKASTRKLRELDPEQLLIAHFGPWGNVWEHLDRLDARLDEWLAKVEGWRTAGMNRDQMIAALRDEVLAEIRADANSSSTEPATTYVTPFYMNVDGLNRYLDKREAQ